jgi:hypothetical protein
MSRFAIRIGLALVVVSIVFAILTGPKHVTVWIPALLGILIALLGWLLARDGPFAVGGMRLVALAGLAACLLQLWKGGFDVVGSHAQQAQAITAALCLLLLVRTVITPSAPPPDAPDWRRHTPH